MSHLVLARFSTLYIIAAAVLLAACSTLKIDVFGFESDCYSVQAAHVTIDLETGTISGEGVTATVKQAGCPQFTRFVWEAGLDCSGDGSVDNPVGPQLDLFNRDGSPIGNSVSVGAISGSFSTGAEGCEFIASYQLYAGGNNPIISDTLKRPLKS